MVDASVFSPVDYGQSTTASIKEPSATNSLANTEKIALIQQSSVAANVFWCSSRKVDESVEVQGTKKKHTPKSKSEKEIFKSVQEYRSTDRVAERSLWSRQLQCFRLLFHHFYCSIMLRHITSRHYQHQSRLTSPFHVAIPRRTV